jgi:hypothetical protein
MINRLSSGKKMFESFSTAFSEDSLDESKDMYPTIPAIEVTIPHLNSS